MASIAQVAGLDQSRAPTAYLSRTSAGLGWIGAAIMARARRAGGGGDHLVEGHADAPPRNFFLVAKKVVVDKYEFVEPREEMGSDEQIS